jgi:prepilin-type N-terminal cleavage/methylation domain-containing protein
MNKSKKITKQSGFSAIELMLVLAAISVFTMVVLFSASKFFGEGSKTQVINDTAVSIPSAVARCSKLHKGNLTSCTKASLLRKAPTLEATTACGDIWTVAPSATKIVLTYPLDSCSGKDNIGNEVVEYVAELPRIDSTATGTRYNSPKLTITYLRK